LVTQLDKKRRSADEMIQPRFMLDEPFNLCYAPSLTSWAIVRQRKNRPVEKASMVGLVEVAGAPPLPGVARDLENVKTVFHDRLGGVYFDDAATVANAKRVLGYPGLLLLATHGMNVADHPLESFVVLQPQEGSDGHLTAAELFETRVATDLVVMNACYSGLADASPLPGDDLFGLQRALLQAGARTVVAGLWDVYDGTAPELIRGLLDRVAAGQAAPAALAQSQREFLKKLRASGDPEPWLHPYFWAVYTVAGDDRTGARK
jgi:CHAT domain-containing protein